MPLWKPVVGGVVPILSHSALPFGVGHLEKENSTKKNMEIVKRTVQCKYGPFVMRGMRKGADNMDELKVEYRKIEDVLPYENNPRNNDDAVQAVAESIQEFGFKIPIVITTGNVIVAGHTRVKAAQELGMKEVPCIIADDLTDEQIRAFRLADNKSAEIATWDEEKLEQELAQIMDIDMSLFGFDDGESDFADEIEDNTYTMKSNIPQYEITGDCPTIDQMLDTGKADSLIAEIEQAEGITDEERRFLVQAARRHNVFNYRNIAEYYAHATPEMQRLMEKSALVIIDMDNAIANGYATLFSDVLDVMEDEDDEG